MTDGAAGWGADFGRELAAEVKAYVTRTIEPLLQRIAALEHENAHVKEMLAHRPFTYMGVYREGAAYNAGAFVTFEGGLWHCNQHHTTTSPDDGNSAWTLALAKRPRCTRQIQ